jgi:hypothetical protein
MTDEINDAITQALKDATVYGHGFISIDPDGNVKYVTLDEVGEIIDELYLAGIKFIP